MSSTITLAQVLVGSVSVEPNGYSTTKLSVNHLDLEDIVAAAAYDTETLVELGQLVQKALQEA